MGLASHRLLIAMLWMNLAIPNEVYAQAVSSSDEHVSPLASGDAGDTQTLPECDSSPNTSTTPTDTVQGNSDDAADQAPYVMPGTGVIFTLPQDPADAAENPCPLPPPLPVRPPALDVFGYSAVPVGSRIIPAQWDVIRSTTFDGVDGPWSELLLQTHQFADSSLLARVNSWVNWHVRYVDDQGADTWASAVETLSRGYGDCEDFAIAKMALLIQSGVPADDMFLILVQERQRPVQHAVLAVRMNGATLILDNRTDKVLPSSKITDYIPLYSYSGPFAWTYGVSISRLPTPVPIPSSGQHVR